MDLCKDVVIENLIIVLGNLYDCLASFNTFGHSVFKNVKCAQLLITYNDDDIHKIHLNKTFGVTINNYKYFYISDTNLKSKVSLKCVKQHNTVHFKIINTQLCKYFDCQLLYEF